MRTICTSGCFDLLHPGHVETLEWAREQGDQLIVLLNDDEGVRILKGSGRPILTWQDRAAMLMALRCVGRVECVAGTNTLPMLRLLKPDLFVKGSDYLGKEIVEHTVCTVFIAPPPRFTAHTSDIITRSCLARPVWFKPEMLPVIRRLVLCRSMPIDQKEWTEPTTSGSSVQTESGSAVCVGP